MKKLTKPKLIKKLDIVFSKYIRVRDALATTKTLTHAKCYTCRNVYDIKNMHAGHWISRAYHATRFEETNVKAQCVRCNTFRNGEHEEFRLHLIQDHGAGEADRLYTLSKTPFSYETDELTRLISHYGKELKLLTSSES